MYTYEMICPDTRLALCVMFLGTKKASIKEVAAELERYFETFLMPDCYILLGAHSALSDLYNMPDDAAISETAFIRIERRSGLFAIPLDEPTGHREIISPKHELPSVTSILDQAMSRGLENLSKVNDVCLVAPKGTNFRLNDCTYPSFIRAGRLCRSASQSEFVASCIFLRFKDQLLNIERIYIDSSTILHLGLSLTTLLCAMGITRTSLAVQSFGSHEGADKIPRPDCKSALFLISASISMSLAKRLRALGVAKSQIITLLAAYDSDCQDESLVLADLSRTFPILINQTQSPTDYSIDVVGEDFLSCDVSLEPFNIVMHDLEKEPRMFFDKFCETELVSDLRKSPDDHACRAWINEKTLTSSKIFNEWFDKATSGHLAKKVNLIIDADQGTMDLFSLKAQGALTDFTDKQPEVTQWNGDSTDFDRWNEVTGVLVVQTVGRSGATLIDISRHLRLKAPKVPVFYMCGLFLANSRGHVRRLQSNLEVTRYGKNVTHFFNTIVTGSDHFPSLQLELDYLDALSQSGTTLPDCFARRLETLESMGSGCQASNLIESVSGEPFALTDGFVFLPKNVKYENVSANFLWLLFSAILQFIREGRGEQGGSLLSGRHFRKECLSVDTFYRFNDSILQVILLKAAKPEELDYSCSQVDSLDMKRLIWNIATGHPHGRGSSVLEFLLSLACGRIKLYESDTASHKLDLIKDLKAWNELPANCQFLLDSMLDDPQD